MFKSISRKKQEQVSFTNEGFTLAKQVTEELEQAEEDGMYFDQMYLGFTLVFHTALHRANRELYGVAFSALGSLPHADSFECSVIRCDVPLVVSFKDCGRAGQVRR